MIFLEGTGMNRLNGLKTHLSKVGRDDEIKIIQKNGGFIVNFLGCEGIDESPDYAADDCFERIINKYIVYERETVC